MADHKGCQKAFAQLAQEHFDGLYRTAFRMTQDRAVAEDIVQETCLRAYANFARYQPDTNFKAWLFRILANLCIDHLRRDAVISMVPIDAVPEPSDGLMPNGGDCPEAQAMRSDTQQALIEALATLAPEPRAVVVMILIEGMSYDDVAESLDMPLGTVRSKLHRARKQLQERLRVNLDQQPRAIVNSTRSSRVVSLF